ncbi:MAG: Mur ligase family protein [Deinococcales bacterium]
MAAFVKGCTHAVVESSSHGLVMRGSSLSYDHAIFTNLSSEHLDYHKTLEAYREAKALLIQRVPLKHPQCR